MLEEHLSSPKKSLQRDKELSSDNLQGRKPVLRLLGNRGTVLYARKDAEQLDVGEVKETMAVDDTFSCLSEGCNWSKKQEEFSKVKE